MSLGPSLPENAHSEGESVTTRGWLERTPDNLIPDILDLVSVLELRGTYIHHACRRVICILITAMILFLFAYLIYTVSLLSSQKS